MENYIKKSEIVAELERRIKKYASIDVGDNRELDALYGAKCHALTSILSFIDTLDMKDVDLENSMVCKVDWYDGFLLDYTQEQQDKLLEKIGANVGDKIKVILIKE